ncbi:zinc finger protein [Aphelenchoides avenae]|nr:zinc finger protein [Aphelenchus avenae]
MFAWDEEDKRPQSPQPTTDDSFTTATTTDSTQGEEDDSLSERTCKICYGVADYAEVDEWMSPCKCSGSVKWVHRECMHRWIHHAPFMQQTQCNACKYQYRKKWHLKSVSKWTMPKLALTKWDVLEIALDAYATANLVDRIVGFVRGTRSLFRTFGYFLFWKAFFATERRLGYYKSLCRNVLSGMFELSILNAEAE